MKPIILLLLISACAGQVIAQPDKAGGEASPARQKSPDKTPIPPGDIPCPHCTLAEQIVVDLIYYKQVLDILEQIEQQRNKINAGLLQSIHAELIKTRPNLATLLKTNNESRTRPIPPVKEVKKPVNKPTKTMKTTPPKQGIEGLAVGHVNEENKELGIKASVVLISNGRPRSLNVGAAIKHNRRLFKILNVIYIEDRSNGNRHEVHLQDQTSKQIHIVPWK